MSAVTNTLENVEKHVASVIASSTTSETTSFYNSWAENYEADMVVLDYRVPRLAANVLSSNFSGDRESSVVLDVACGTGLAAKELKAHGFGNFVGIDGSQGMLEGARKTGLYKDLKKCVLGEEPLPVQWGSFDIVTIVGALIAGHIPVNVVGDLCKAAKPGGYVCITSRDTTDNVEYKAALDRELKKIEEAGLWTLVDSAEMKDWHKAMLEKEDCYVAGIVYIYKKL